MAVIFRRLEAFTCLSLLGSVQKRELKTWSKTAALALQPAFR